MEVTGREEGKDGIEYGFVYLTCVLMCVRVCVCFVRVGGCAMV